LGLPSTFSLFGFDQAVKNADQLTAAVHDRRAAIAMRSLPLDQQVAVDLGGVGTLSVMSLISVAVDLRRSPL
jgi:hypothetical protein